MKYAKGAAIREPGNSVEKNMSGWREKRPEVDRAKCNNCGICWMFCPDNAIYKNEKGVYVWDYRYCKGCGICATECPLKAINLVEEEK